MGLDEVDVVSREIETIKNRLQVSMDRQKKFTQNYQRPLEFEVCDQVFLKVSLMRGMMRFGKNGKLSHWCVGPFKVIERISEVAY